MRYRVFLMLVANSLAAKAPALARMDKIERRARELQIDPKRMFIESRLLPRVADVSVLRAAVLPPSDRIAVHVAFYSPDDPASLNEQTLHIRANTLWPVARVRNASGEMTVISLLADRQGRVRREYRTESAAATIIAGRHGVIVDRTDNTPRGLEIHGRAWHVSGQARAFSALVRRSDVGYTFDLGKLAGHSLRADVRGSSLVGLSAVGEG